MANRPCDAPHLPPSNTYDDLDLPLAAEEFPNPLVLQRAEPWIHKHSDGFYYFVGTAP